MKSTIASSTHTATLNGEPPNPSMSPDLPSSAANPRRSVRGKLMRVVLITTAVAVSASGAAMLTYDLSVYRTSWVTELATQAAILGLSVAPALEFDDHEVAERDLGAMRVRRRVLVAALYTLDGHLYASYARDSSVSAPQAPPPYGQLIAGERVEMSAPVIHNGERLGTIYLRASYDLESRLLAYAKIFPLVMMASLAVAYALSRRLQKAIVDPLDAMTGVARQIASGRDYSLRASKTTDDEIGVAVLVFNRMLEEIQAGARASATANVALQAEIQVRQAAEAALLEADRRKDEFLATLAHELRNPLAPIRYSIKLMESNTANEQQQQWGRAVITRQLQRMALLLDDLLDVARITSGRLNLRLDLVDLRSVVDAALEIARPLIDAKKQQLVVDLPAEHLKVSCDSLRLSQSLSNLLTNAAKYTNAEGRVALTVELTASELRFAVKDSGIGIEPKATPKLFRIFSQLDSAIDRAEGGLGIGLALAKGLVELHGGRVEVFSDGLGLGSEFTIVLPRSLVVVGTENTVLANVAEKHNGNADLRILLVDDNRDAADSMALLLKFQGFHVIVAYNGNDALKMAEENSPDVILLDIGMPDMSGYDVARYIRQSEWGQTMYLIAVTGWGQAEDKRKAIAVGFDCHLTKPVDPDHVGKLLHDLTSKANVP
jgi:two-component system, sensor histidine kinase